MRLGQSPDGRRSIGRVRGLDVKPPNQGSLDSSSEGYNKSGESVTERINFEERKLDQLLEEAKNKYPVVEKLLAILEEAPQVDGKDEKLAALRNFYQETGRITDEFKGKFMPELTLSVIGGLATGVIPSLIKEFLGSGMDLGDLGFGFKNAGIATAAVFLIRIVAPQLVKLLAKYQYVSENVDIRRKNAGR